MVVLRRDENIAIRSRDSLGKGVELSRGSSRGVPVLSLLQQGEFDLAKIDVVDFVSSWLSCLELGEEELGDAVSKTLGAAPGRRVVAGATQNNL